MALIYSQVSKEELQRRLKDIEPLEAPYELTEEVLNETTNVTASMGIEQIVHALEEGADVIFSGQGLRRRCLGAYPIYKGFPKGISLHMGKAAECASLVCWPQMVKESIIATVTKEYFSIEPMHPAQRATPHSVAAHSMYERTNPFVQECPAAS